MTKLYDPNVFQVKVFVDYGMHIEVTHAPTGKVKKFFIAAACEEEFVPIYERHMDSLTDDLLLQWFEPKGGKPKKEKKNVNSPTLPEGS